ncbi:MAG: hypothetical protein PHX57_09285 [Desulfobulbaceae bacterium]|nr:hypothetical protein [Desulfobulbaceae bacterium]
MTGGAVNPLCRPQPAGSAREHEDLGFPFVLDMRVAHTRLPAPVQ